LFRKNYCLIIIPKSILLILFIYWIDELYASAILMIPIYYIYDLVFICDFDGNECKPPSLFFLMLIINLFYDFISYQ